MAEGKHGAQEAWRTYLELALGVTEASRKKAQKAAKRLAGRGGATAQQLQVLADNLVSTSLANREALTKLVRGEVDRALGAVGLATVEEVADLQRRIADLERRVRDGQPAVGLASPAAAPVKKAVAKKVVAKKAVTKTTPATAVAKKAVARKAVAKKVAKKAVAKKAVPGQLPAAAPTTPATTPPTTPPAPAKKVAPPAGMAPE
jgi:polyhydroxyalkanoate synthesis regulator phasin